MGIARTDSLGKLCISELLPLFLQLLVINRGEMYDSALPSVMHPRTSLSSRHNKEELGGVIILIKLSCCIVKHSQRTAQTNNYATGKSVLRLSNLAPVVIWGCPTWPPAKRLELGVRLDGTRSSRAVVSAAPPAAIVYPARPACVTFLLLHPVYVTPSPLLHISAH